VVLATGCGLNELDSWAGAAMIQKTNLRAPPPSGLRMFSQLSWRLTLTINGLMFFAMVIVFVVAGMQADSYVMGFLSMLEKSLGQRLATKMQMYSDMSFVGSNTFIVLMCGAGLVVGGIIAHLVTKQIIRPLNLISETATRVAQGNFKARIPLSKRQTASADELTRLAVSFNTMTESLDKLETERLATNAAIAHELRMPLMILEARIEAVRDDVMPMGAEDAQRLLGQVQTLVRSVEDLRTLSLVDAGRLDIRLERIDLVDVLTLTVASFSVRTDAKNISININARMLSAPIRGDRDRLTQVIANLLENAYRYTPEGGTISIDVFVQAQRVRLFVHDSGPGFPRDALPHLFKRFYRFDRSRNRVSGGSGLGLSLVKIITELHGGSVHATNARDGGAQVEVRLPCASN
jgi:two-component system, OmpR family, sensor histidine kinase BaeS